MKLNKLTFGIIAAVCLAFSAQAQTTTTNVPNLMGDIGNVLGDIGLSSNPTNYAFAPFFGVKTTKNADGKRPVSAGLVIIENVNNNIGIAGGIDHLWLGGKAGSANIVSGGLSLKAPFYPLRYVTSFLGTSLGTNTWAYNFLATPYAIVLIGTPLNGTSNDGGLANINRAGVNFDVYNFKGWKLGAGGDYGNRNGAGNYSGNWIDFTLNVRKGF